MNREEYIKLLKTKSGLEIVYEYCKYRGKEEFLVSKFVAALLLNPIEQQYYIEYAIDYFDREFDIIYLTDKNNKIIQIY